MNSANLRLESEIDSIPLVSCIMPTYNRRRFVPMAIKYFLRQDYPRRELIIVDDGCDPVKDLVPPDPYIQYIRLQKKQSLGTKRNIACEEANGDIIAHWDDDDWMAPWRLSYQVIQLCKNEKQVCGNDKLLFFDLRSQILWIYEFPIRKKRWMAGGSLCYQKSFWAANKFEDINVGEDTRFIWDKLQNGAFVLPEFKYYVAMIHPGNTAPKSLSSSYWKRWHKDTIRSLIDDDWIFYS